MPGETAGLFAILARVRSRLVRTAVLEAAMALAAGLSALLCLATLAALAGLRGGPLVLLEAAGLLLLFALVGLRYAILLRQALGDPAGVALWMDKALGRAGLEQEVSLTSAVELHRDRGLFHESEALAEEGVRIAEKETEALDWARLVSNELRGSLRAKAGLLGASAAAALLLSELLPGPFALAAGAARSLGSLEDAMAPAKGEPHLGEFRITARPPAYTKRPSRTAKSNTGTLRALPGTEVVIETQSRELLEDATLVITSGAREGEEEVVGRSPVEIQGRNLKASFVVTRAGRYRFFAVAPGGEELEERRGHRIELEVDEVPRVTLSQPKDSPLEVNENDQITLEITADDDFGLGDIRFAYRVMGSTRQGYELLSSTARGREHFHSELRLELSRLKLAPGDRVAYSVEALDNDSVTGPKVGASETKELRVYSKEAHHREVLALQQAALDELVHILGDNLESLFRHEPEMDRAKALLATAEKILERARNANELLSSTIDAIRRDPLGREAVATAFEQARRDLSRDTARKRKTVRAATQELRRTSTPSRAQSVQIGRSQDQMIAGLERNVVYLADLLNDQRMLDAENLMKELRAEQQALRDALEAYRSAPDEERRKLLEEAIRDIRKRISEITAQLAEMQGSIPSEYVNPDALEGSDTQAGMERLERMVEEGNLDTAMQELERMLAETERMIARMQSGRKELGTREYSKVSEMAKKMWDDLEGIERDQRALSEKTNEQSDSVSGRMRSRLGDAEDFVEKQMRRLGEAAESIERSEPGVPRTEGDAFDQLLRRMDDTGKALQGKDFGAAKEMLGHSLRHLAQLELDAERRLEHAKRFGDFFGDTKQIEDALKGLRRASSKLEAVARDIDRLMPNPAELLSEQELEQLQQQAKHQSDLGKRMEDMQRQLDELGQELPIVGEGTKEIMGEAQGAMNEAEDQLRQGDAPGASSRQRQALDALGRLKEALEQMGQGSSEGGGMPLPFGTPPPGGSGGDQGDQGLDPRSMEKVEIPKPEQYRAPTEFREEILEAAKKGTVESYREAVRRYYEEIVK